MILLQVVSANLLLRMLLPSIKKLPDVPTWLFYEIPLGHYYILRGRRRIITICPRQVFKKLCLTE